MISFSRCGTVQNENWSVERGISDQSDAEGSQEYRCMPSLKVVLRHVVAAPWTGD